MQNVADSHRLLSLAEKMHDKEYRDGYVAAHTRQVLAKQMREFRGATPQTQFAQIVEKRQTMVSRLENPSYIGWTLSTMFEIASRLDVAVFARFVDFATFLKYSGRQSDSDLHPQSYDAAEIDDFARQKSAQDASNNTVRISIPQSYPIASIAGPVQLGWIPEEPALQKFTWLQSHILPNLQMQRSRSIPANETMAAMQFKSAYDTLKSALDIKEGEVEALKAKLVQKEAENKILRERAMIAADPDETAFWRPLQTGQEPVMQGL